MPSMIGAPVIRRGIDPGCVQEIARLQRFGQYRHYKIMSVQQQLRLQEAKLSACLHTGDAIMASVYMDGHVSGYGIYLPLSWDSDHFGIKMGRLEIGLSSQMTLDGAVEFVRYMIAGAESAGARHVSVSVDSEDHLLIRALGRSGFDLLDTKLNYIARPQALPRKEGRLSVRKYQDTDRSVVAGMVASLYFPSRFSKDEPRIAEKAASMYCGWVDRLQSAGPEAVVIVACRQERVVAFAGMSPIEFDFPEAGRLLLGNSLLACGNEGLGSSYSLVGYGINKGLQRYSAIEFSTSLTNLGMIRILEAHDCCLAGSSLSMRWMAGSL